jgi:murein DD-endopeptidase MepM/ murein hydrolase activator NlpD
MRSKFLFFLKKIIVKLFIVFLDGLVLIKKFFLFFLRAIARPIKWIGNAALFSFVIKIYKVYLFVKIKLAKYYLPVKNKFIYPLTRRYVTHSVLILIAIFAITANIQAKEASLEQSEYVGQKSILFALNRESGEEFDVDELVIEESTDDSREKVLNYLSREAGLIAPGGSVGSNLSLLPVNPEELLTLNGEGEERTKAIEYKVEEGDTIGGIAEKFNLKVVTILWANKLTERSLIRPGDRLVIMPVDGVLHQVKRNDTISSIAKYYGAESGKIVEFNALADAGDINVGEFLIVPDGKMPVVRAPAPRIVSRLNSPKDILQIPSVKPSADGRMVWPSAARILTQYYGWRHSGLDIAGSKNSAIYAAKAGTVEVSQCGWNGGYGCYVIINHGGGTKTLYGHNNKLLVSAGEEVEAGQAIATMGNTGNVRGRTGIHLHFEVIIGGRRQNPLNYL